ncbi:MAG: HlyD family efflux transporter periplasmic adaptor subunit [Oscillospiraceae bacterium]|jgi:multidrug efflux pump subunit AcrA (membrane-fusion protein)|nr:HlyD family efflux transporter periplasmic adaptor subunit [Oscillospiraceae bacterium]
MAVTTENPLAEEVEIGATPTETSDKPERRRKPKKPKKQRKALKRVIVALIIAAILGGIGYVLYTLFREQTQTMVPLTDFVYRGSIRSMVMGGGVTKAKNSATVVLPAGGDVLEIFVAEGDTVQAGDPLYIIDSADAQKAVDDAQKAVDDVNKQIAAIYDSYKDLITYAPFSGKLTDTVRLTEGDTVSGGTKLATLVDDSIMLVTLYFSYAYENDLYINQPAAISIPATMSELRGQVREINLVRKITPEGSILFQAVLEVPNPGALVSEMLASATLKTKDGEDIYPYEPGKLESNRKSDVLAKVTGSVIEQHLMDYADVQEGALLLSLSGDNNDDKLEALQRQLEAALEQLNKAQNNLGNFNAVAPIGGTVMSCSLTAGEHAEAGRTAVTISDTSVMLVDARIDEMNVTYVKTGMTTEITQWGREGQLMFTGVIDTVSLEGTYENGISVFPAVIRVDNPDGTLMPGMYVDYSLVASQAEDCLIVPMEAVKYTEGGTCLFIRADTRPENALTDDVQGLEVPQGFYAVPVTIGLSDNSQVQIVDGVEEGTEVFRQMVASEDGMSNGGISVGRAMKG